MKYAINMLFMDQCKIFYFIFCTCRFSSRVLIENKKTRQLLASYAKRGMSTVEMEEVMREVNLHAPFLTPLLSSIDKASENSHTCPPQWKRFILSISSSSPVCALIPPSSFNLIQEICEKDIKSQPEVCLLLLYFGCFLLLSPFVEA